MKKKPAPENEYRVEFAIDVWSPNPAQACQRAWDLLSAPEAMLPVGTVTLIDKQNPKDQDMVGESEDIDLQALYDEAHSS